MRIAEPLWFWSLLCFAAMWAGMGIGIATQIVIPFGPSVAWVIPVGCWINAALLCGIARHERLAA